jgi:pimeloyl-ACP methyl ester carboxylesterase
LFVVVVAVPVGAAGGVVHGFNRWASASLLLVLVLGMFSVGGGVDAATVPPLEARYRAAGPWSVTRRFVVDANGRSFDIYSPSPLGVGGRRHPVITWGNGTLVPVDAYDPLLRHLASWGFVVIASSSLWTGSGEQILAGAEYLRAEDQRPGSPFYHHLDLSNVGAMGHSQGAYGALSAAARSGGLIKTVVPINLPDRRWLSTGQAVDLTQVQQAVLLVGGTSDWLSTPLGLLDYTRELSGSVVALRRGAGHDAVVSPTGGYVGYVTAWLLYQLQGDRVAAGAFRGPQAELTHNPDWEPAPVRP